MTEHHVDHDNLVALALQQVEPEERARLSEHVARCGRCREAYTELAEAVQHTLTAAPSIAPPAGFSGRVLEALQREGSPAPILRRRWLVAAAAALVVGLGLGIGGTLVVTEVIRPAESAPRRRQVDADRGVRLLDGRGATGRDSSRRTPHAIQPGLGPSRILSGLTIRPRVDRYRRGQGRARHRRMP